MPEQLGALAAALSQRDPSDPTTAHYGRELTRLIQDRADASSPAGRRRWSERAWVLSLAIEQWLSTPETPDA